MLKLPQARANYSSHELVQTRLSRDALRRVREARIPVPLIRVRGDDVSRGNHLTRLHTLTVVYRIVRGTEYVVGHPRGSTLRRMKNFVHIDT
jgi:hypothetical protein